MSHQIEKLLLVGVGLIGASAGLAARERGIARKIVGFSRRRKTLEEARRVGAIHSFETDLEKAAQGADFVLVSVPVAAIAERVGEAARAALAPGAVITDAGSVKGSIVAAVLRDGVAAPLFVGSHPIAGTEKSGPRAAQPDLFEGRKCIVTPVEGTGRSRLARVKAFWKSLGMRVETLAPEGHDEALALTSHMPHLLAYALSLTAQSRESRGNFRAARFAGGGFRDMTRIAASSPGMWREIVEHNGPATARALAEFISQLAHLDTAVSNGNWNELEIAFERAAKYRRALEGRLGGPGKGKRR